jgi:hypothetical protein
MMTRLYRIFTVFSVKYSQGQLFTQPEEYPQSEMNWQIGKQIGNCNAGRVAKNK